MKHLLPLFRLRTTPPRWCSDPHGYRQGQGMRKKKGQGASEGLCGRERLENGHSTALQQQRAHTPTLHQCHRTQATSRVSQHAEEGARKKGAGAPPQLPPPPLSKAHAFSAKDRGHRTTRVPFCNVPSRCRASLELTYEHATTWQLEKSEAARSGRGKERITPPPPAQAATPTHRATHLAEGSRAPQNRNTHPHTHAHAHTTAPTPTTQDGKQQQNKRTHTRASVQHTSGDEHRCAPPPPA